MSLALHRFLLVAAAAVPSLAAAQALQPGLWELQHKMQGNPQMDQAMAEMHKQMAAMTPQQRKQMEAAMAGSGVQMGSAPGGAMTVKMCMTREMAERNEVPASQGDCKTTQQARTGNTMKMSFTCTKPPSSGESQVTITSPQAYTMKTTATTVVNGKPEKMTMEGSGRWLAADCGSVKPPVVPKK